MRRDAGADADDRGTEESERDLPHDTRSITGS